MVGTTVQIPESIKSYSPHHFSKNAVNTTITTSPNYYHPIQIQSNQNKSINGYYVTQKGDMNQGNANSQNFVNPGKKL